MKLCVGLILIFACPDDKAKPTSDFCEIAGPMVRKVQALSAAELAALQRPRKEAIRDLRRTYQRNCVAKERSK
jgi:hypothetical protein